MFVISQLVLYGPLQKCPFIIIYISCCCRIIFLIFQFHQFPDETAQMKIGTTLVLKFVVFLVTAQSLSTPSDVFFPMIYKTYGYIIYHGRECAMMNNTLLCSVSRPNDAKREY
jgi:hypothetical protein